MKRYWGMGTLILFTIILLAHLVSYGQQGLSKFKSNYEDLIKNYQFSKAVKLCEDALKNPRIARSAKTQAEIKVLLDEAQRQYRIFDWLIKDITQGEKGIKVDLGVVKFWVDEANEEYVEGPVENIPGSCYRKRWSELEPRVIYGLFDISKLGTAKKEALFNLSILWYNHNLPDKADRLLIRHYKRCPQAKEQISQLISRKKGIPIPPGGFVVYHKRWVTPEDKANYDKGLVKFQDKWMTYDQVMVAKGLVKYQGKWCTPKELARVKSEADGLARIKSKYNPTGVLHKRGCDSERLPWAQHRTKQSQHYTVKSNLSEAALNDIICIMESLYFNHNMGFRLKGTAAAQKSVVYAYKNLQEYSAIGGPRGSGGFFNFRDKRLVTYYIFYTDKKTGEVWTMPKVLLHEGTHQFVDLAMNGKIPPIWINEALGTYYECSKFEKGDLVVNCINKIRLALIQEQMQANRHIRLKSFINLPQQRYKLPEYAQGWSMMYYLINAKDNRYAPAVNQYFDELKTSDITMRNITQKAAQHIELFERVFNIPLEDLEREWKEYIIKIKPPEEKKK